MRVISAEEFQNIIKTAAIKPRFKRDLKFTTSTEGLAEADWAERELLPIWNKSGNGGVLLIQPDDELFIVAFDDGSRTGDANGRIKPIICDFCYTWQPGREGGFVTFYPDRSGDNSISLLCCADFGCSLHARGKTLASKRARTQIREHISDEDRVERLKKKLNAFIARQHLGAVA